MSIFINCLAEGLELTELDQTFRKFDVQKKNQ